MQNKREWCSYYQGGRCAVPTSEGVPTQAKVASEQYEVEACERTISNPEEIKAFFDEAPHLERPDPLPPQIILLGHHTITICQETSRWCGERQSYHAQERCSHYAKKAA